jgi:hypothetical protein
MKNSFPPRRAIQGLTLSPLAGPEAPQHAPVPARGVGTATFVLEPLWST